MEPLIIKSQLSIDEYYKLNLRVLWKKFRIILGIAIAIMVIFYCTDYLHTKEGDTTLMWLGLYFLFLFILFPIVTVIKARRQFIKIKAMSEPKTYQFTGKGMHIEGITTTVSLDWSNVNRTNERKNYLEIGMYNSKSFVILKRTDFAGDDELNTLKDLIKSKGIKNNFK